MILLWVPPKVKTVTTGEGGKGKIPDQMLCKESVTWRRVTSNGLLIPGVFGSEF